MAVKKQKKQKAEEEHTCRECEHCTEVTIFHTLSVKGEPTMGTCPYWKQSKCVLLSQKSCQKFKGKAIT